MTFWEYLKALIYLFLYFFSKFIIQQAKSTAYQNYL
jgi:hypothetical protein